MDATFKVVKSPFTQLFSIHAFVKQDEDIRHLPLAYTLMSRKRRRDYKKVLQAILDLLPQEIAIEAAVAEFETALWQAMAKVVEDISIQGSVFHWTQAVWRKVQSIGLSTAHTSDQGTYDYVRRLMALNIHPSGRYPCNVHQTTTRSHK